MRQQAMQGVQLPTIQAAYPLSRWVKVSMLHLVSAAALMAVAATVGLSTSAAAMSVPGEPVKAENAQKKSALDTQFRASLDAEAPIVSFFAVDPKRIEAAKHGNIGKFRKATQIGVTQYSRDEAFDSAHPTLAWRNVFGGSVAQFKVRSPGATAVRVGLYSHQLPAGAEIRFAGSDAPTNVLHRATGLELYTLIDDEKRYWTPMTDGDTQIIEVFVPTTIGHDKISFEINAVSHIFASIKDGFKAATQLKGNSGACNVDSVCPTQTPALLEARRAVAHMVFQANCGAGGTLSTCICTGTLLNDTDTATQVPYFYSANHCMSTQTQASTLQTFWNYDNPVCSGADIPRSQATSVAGGAQLLYNDQNSDVLLLRLNSAPPQSAFFSGWDSTAVVGLTPTTIIHHPAGDPKKITIGQTPASPFINLTDMGNTSYIVSTYTSGVTEGGSSGSGLFTQNATGTYFLRGGLLGGPSSCSTAGDINNPSNRDYYSRFDQAFANLRSFLAPSASNGPINYSDMWWAGNNAAGQALENGWGMSIQQHSPSNIQFNALYIYDDSGRPVWVVMPGGTWSNNFTTFSGPVFIPSGAPFSNYNTQAFVANPSVGTVTLNFQTANTASMNYTINGRGGTKNITRQVFGSGSAPFNVNDLWWGGAAQNGWGINLAQQQGQIFAVWYTYGADGRATWFVMPGGSWNGTSFNGSLFRTLGSAWIATQYNQSLLQVVNVGSMRFDFANPNSAIMTYTVDGLTQQKPLERQAF
jgi:lysyl endopeptidase